MFFWYKKIQILFFGGFLARLFDQAIDVASGRAQTKAQILGQDDFLPWKRGVSL